MEPHVPASFLPRSKTQIEPNTSDFTRVPSSCLGRKSYKGAVGIDVEFFHFKPARKNRARDNGGVNSGRRAHQQRGAFQWGRRTRQEHPAKRRSPELAGERQWLVHKCLKTSGA